MFIDNLKKNSIIFKCKDKNDCIENHENTQYIFIHSNIPIT